MSHIRTLPLGQSHGWHFMFRLSRIVSNPQLTSFQKLVGFENYFAEMIITTRQCVVYENHVAHSNVKVPVHTHILCIGLSCAAHNFILRGGIWKLFGINYHQAKTMCPVQEPCCYIKGQVYSSHLQFMHRLKWNLSFRLKTLLLGLPQGWCDKKIWFSIHLYGPIKGLSYSRH